MIEEIAIYEKENIKITNLRAVFGEKTYSVSNITSVETKRIDPSGCAPAALAVFGIFSVLAGVSNFKENSGWLFFGLLAFGLLFLINRTSKPSWAVSLTTASGEVKAYISPNQDEIKQIVEALNNAIIRKG